MALCRVTTVVRSGSSGRKAAAKYRSMTAAYWYGCVERVVAAHLGGGLRILLAVERPREVGRRGHLRLHRWSACWSSSMSPRPAGHSTRARTGSPFASPWFRRSPHSWSRSGGLHDIDAVGRVMKGNGGGSQDEAGGRGLRTGDGHLVKRLVQLCGERRLIGKERERQPETRRGLRAAPGPAACPSSQSTFSKSSA